MQIKKDHGEMPPTTDNKAKSGVESKWKLPMEENLDGLDGVSLDLRELNLIRGQLAASARFEPHFVRKCRIPPSSDSYHNKQIPILDPNIRPIGSENFALPPVTHPEIMQSTHIFYMSPKAVSFIREGADTYPPGWITVVETISELFEKMPEDYGQPQFLYPQIANWGGAGCMMANACIIQCDGWTHTPHPQDRVSLGYEVYRALEPRSLLGYARACFNAGLREFQVEEGATRYQISDQDWDAAGTDYLVCRRLAVEMRDKGPRQIFEAHRAHDELLVQDVKDGD